MASSHKNVIIGNRVSNDEHYGIELQNCDMNNVSGNICIDNTIGIRLYNGSDNNTVTDNICVRGSGQPGDYTSDQYTIYVAPGGTVPKNNLFVGNNIMGKNYVDNGTNNTWANNKFE